MQRGHYQAIKTVRSTDKYRKHSLGRFTEVNKENVHSHVFSSRDTESNLYCGLIFYFKTYFMTQYAGYA